jgi:hypothetical protein
MEDNLDVTLPTIHQALIDAGLPVVGVSGDPANPKTLRIDWEGMPSKNQVDRARTIMDGAKPVRKRPSLDKAIVKGLTTEEKDAILCQIMVDWTKANIDRALTIAPSLKPHLLEEL